MFLYAFNSLGLKINMSIVSEKENIYICEYKIVTMNEGLQGHLEHYTTRWWNRTIFFSYRSKAYSHRGHENVNLKCYWKLVWPSEIIQGEKIEGEW